MPLSLFDKISGSEVPLDSVTFVQESDHAYFSVCNSINKIGIDVKYIPQEISNWDKNRFKLFVLVNPYLNAENDIFEVYEHTLTNEKLGWIFPITILVAHSYEDENKNLNHYKFIAYQKLLEIEKKINPLPQTDFYTLTEILDDSYVICLLNTDALNKIENFEFSNYLPSLYSFGYSLFSETIKPVPISFKIDTIRQNRTERKRINLKKSQFSINDNIFLNFLFKDILVKEIEPVLRFFLLYQVIEQLLEEEYEKQFREASSNFVSKAINKNDLKELLSDMAREKYLLNLIFNRIHIEHALKQEFEQECDTFFKEIKYDNKKSFVDKLYAYRNLLIHRFREFPQKKETIGKITEIFERIIIELLINYA